MTATLLLLLCVVAHFEFGKYVDSVLEARVSGKIQRGRDAGSSSERQRVFAEDNQCQDYLVLAIEQYIEALKLDNRHVYQALPRLLSLWFEFTVSINSARDSRAALKAKQHNANGVVSQSLRAIPPSTFYTAMPQLISRVTHQNSDTAMIVQTILTRLLTKFPCQSMWNLAWLRSSVNQQRAQIGDSIFRGAQESLAKRKDQKNQALLVASKSLVKFLIDLSK